MCPPRLEYLALSSAKSGGSDRHVIDVRNQVLGRVLANGVGGRLDRRALRDVLDSNGGISNRRSRASVTCP